MINFTLPHDAASLAALDRGQLEMMSWLLGAYLADEPMLDPLTAASLRQSLTEVRRRLVWTEPTT